MNVTSMSPSHTAFDSLLLVEAVVGVVVVLLVLSLAWAEAKRRRCLLQRMTIHQENKSGKERKGESNESGPSLTSLSYAEWRHLLSALSAFLLAIVAVVAQFAVNSTTMTLSAANENWMIALWCILLPSLTLCTQLSSAVVIFDTHMSLRPVEARRLVYKILVITVIALIIAIVLSIILAILLVLVAGAASSSNNSGDSSCNCCASTGGSAGGGGGMYSAPYYYFWGGYYPYGYGFYSPWMFMYYPFFWGGRYRSGHHRAANNHLVTLQQSYVVTSQPTTNQSPRVLRLTAKQKAEHLELSALLFYRPPPFYKHLTSLAFIALPIAVTTAYYYWNVDTGGRDEFRQTFLAFALYGGLGVPSDDDDTRTSVLVPQVWVWSVVALATSVAYVINSLLTLRCVHHETHTAVVEPMPQDANSALPPPDYTPAYPSAARLWVSLFAHLALWTAPNIALLITSIVSEGEKEWSTMVVYIMLVGAFVDMLGHSAFYAVTERRSAKIIQETIKHFR